MNYFCWTHILSVYYMCLQLYNVTREENTRESVSHRSVYEE
jgi:hypothetical protein